MSQHRPFVDSNTDELDYDWLVDEAIPIAKLLFVFGIVGAFLVLLSSSMRPGTFQQLIAFAGQFVFSLGGFVTLLYVIVRALQLNEALEAGDIGSYEGTGGAAGSGGRTRIDVKPGNRSDETGDVAGTNSTSVDDGADRETGDGSESEDRQ